MDFPHYLKETDPHYPCFRRLAFFFSFKSQLIEFVCAADDMKAWVSPMIKKHTHLHLFPQKHSFSYLIYKNSYMKYSFRDV